MGFLRKLFGEAKPEPATDRQRSYLDDLFDRSGTREIVLSEDGELKVRVPKDSTLTEVLDRRYPGLLSKEIASQLIDGIIEHNRQVDEERRDELQALEGVPAKSQRYAQIAKRLNAIDDEVGLSSADEFWDYVADLACNLNNYDDSAEIPFECPVTAALLRQVLKGMDERQARELIEFLDEELADLRE